MTENLGIGVVGCGNISAAYMRLAPLFRGIEMRACADLNVEAAQARASEFGLRAISIDDLMAAEDVDIVLNLTIPAAHFDVSLRAIEAGKHVYSEKPYVLEAEDGSILAAKAAEKSVRIGSAPDTFMGGTHQLARHLVDGGAVGRITSGTCFVQGPGMEMWHPDPDFFFQPGAGPVLDMGPYYITNLIQLLGPVAKVAAMGMRAQERRTITSQPRFGETIPVDVDTTVHAILGFQSGAQITFCASWDVWQHGHSHMELYGTKGTLHLPDPNFFGGDLRVTEKGEFVDLPADWDHPMSQANDGEHANYRTVGLADMAMAIQEDRPHRCSDALALHAVDVMSTILSAADEGEVLEVETSCEQPAPFTPADARALMR
ncbi:MAG: Gfo/Idh/MocA family oxidoreductase [Pseudomonadota bacterium]